MKKLCTKRNLNFESRQPKVINCTTMHHELMYGNGISLPKHNYSILFDQIGRKYDKNSQHFRQIPEFDEVN